MKEVQDQLNFQIDTPTDDEMRRFFEDAERSAAPRSTRRPSKKSKKQAKARKRAKRARAARRQRAKA